MAVLAVIGFVLSVYIGLPELNVHIQDEFSRCMDCLPTGVTTLLIPVSPSCVCENHAEHGSQQIGF